MSMSAVFILDLKGKVRLSPFTTNSPPFPPLYDLKAPDAATYHCTFKGT